MLNSFISKNGHNKRDKQSNGLKALVEVKWRVHNFISNTFDLPMYRSMKSLLWNAHVTSHTDGQYQPCISYGSHAAYVGDGMCFKVYNNKRTTASSAKVGSLT